MVETTKLIDMLQKPELLTTEVSIHGPLPPPEASGDAGLVLMKKTAVKQAIAFTNEMILTSALQTVSTYRRVLL